MMEVHIYTEGWGRVFWGQLDQQSACKDRREKSRQWHLLTSAYAQLLFHTGNGSRAKRREQVESQQCSIPFNSGAPVTGTWNSWAVKPPAKLAPEFPRGKAGSIGMRELRLQFTHSKLFLLSRPHVSAGSSGHFHFWLNTNST